MKTPSLKTPSLPDLFNAQQVAVRWSLSEKTLERWRSVGTGPEFIKMGGRVLYRRAAIEAHEIKLTRSNSSRLHDTTEAQ